MVKVTYWLTGNLPHSNSGEKQKIKILQKKNVFKYSR